MSQRELAARTQGSARIAQVVEVSCARSEANIARVVAALVPPSPNLRGAPKGLPFEWSRRTLRAGINFTPTTTVRDIDLFGKETRLLGLEWLIHVKRAAGRPKNLEMIAESEVLWEAQPRTAATTLAAVIPYSS